MFKKTSKVVKYASEISSYQAIVPTKRVIPNWYKNTSKHLKNHIPFKLPFQRSFKACTPFLEALTVGYVLTTLCDIGIDNTTETDTVVTWNKELNFDPVGHRSSDFIKLNQNIPIPTGFSSQHFVWHTQSVYTIPKGYSVLVTHPLNRFDLPFLTLSGVIDGYMTVHTGNIPVFFNKTFNGIIPRGTPYAQLVFFKTEDWNSKEDLSILKEEKSNQVLTRAIAEGWYKKSYWRKKVYN